MSIPKIIHYCWFGGKPKPSMEQKCIASWKKFCPDYEIIEWNENTFDTTNCPPFVHQTIETKKWAFLTDYIRMEKIYEMGGIYLDTDVELLKPLDPLLEYPAYFGFETSEFVNTGHGFGAEKHSPIVKELLKIYDTYNFVLPDGSINQTASPHLHTPVLEKFGLVPNGQRQLLSNGALVLPMDYFCPVDYESGVCTRTKNTISIHWYSASWKTKDEQREKKAQERALRRERFLFKLSRMPNKIGMAVFGEERYVKIRAFLKGHD